jgi:lipoprotein-releasing system ATP-binding protein
MTVVLACDALTKHFQQGDTRVDVLRGIELTISAGERVAVVGASGSGKTTLLQLLGGLDLPTGGTVSIAGQRINELSDAQRGVLRNRALGFVYQFHHLLPEFSALENVVLPQMIRGLPRKEAKNRATELLNYLGLKDRLVHRPAELSGGEQQRVAIARAVANAPRILLADEPTGNLDPRTSERVFGALTQLVRASGLAMICATHNMDIAARMDRRVSLRDGAVVELE